MNNDQKKSEKTVPSANKEPEDTDKQRLSYRRLTTAEDDNIARYKSDNKNPGMHKEQNERYISQEMSGNT